MVFTIGVQDEKGLTDDSHLVIVPVYPVKLNNALVLPEHIVVPPVTFPPTDKG